MSSNTSPKNPRYSVIIVTYNSRDNIRVCLDSLRRNGNGPLGADAGGSHEVIVVDNASRDGTQEFLSAQSDIRSILNGGNNGFSKGCNQGAAIAKGDFVIFLNPDTLVTPGWSDAMARYFQDPGVGAVGPVSNYVAGLQRLDTNLPPAWRDAKSFPGNGPIEVAASVARILKEANDGRGVTTKLLIGFCLMMPRARFEALGGMDEDLFLGNDDLDLSWRLRNLGLKLVVASDAFVFHEGQKSFQTEKKSHVDRLVQESTDALYKKLVRHYGGREKVPSATELWGMGWFSPSPSLLNGPWPDSEASMKNDTTAWNDVTVAAYAAPIEGANEDAAARLDRTLASLPARAGTDILALNCAGANAAVEAPAGPSLRKLDLGHGFAPKQALEIALSLAQGSHILFCLAGVESSALFNHWLDKRDLASLPASMPLPLRIGEGIGGEEDVIGGAEAGREACAFLCRKEWLRDALASMPAGSDAGAFLKAMGEALHRNVPASGKIDPPWLMIRSGDVPGIPAQTGAAAKPPADDSEKTLQDVLAALRGMGGVKALQTGIPESLPPRAAQSAGSAKGIDLFPESLRPAIRASQSIAFAGSKAQPLPRSGVVRVFDLQDNLVPLGPQDLVILRVTPDLVDGLVERLSNMRMQGTDLKRVVAVFDSSLARREKQVDKFLPNPDLTPEGMAAAFRRAGYTIIEEKPYAGFSDGRQGVPLKGWHQIEAAPRASAHLTRKKVSIIILGFNQVEYTRKCIESIRKYTRQDYELILVDNGSKDGTEAYFRSIPGAKVVRNAENLGVSKGWNQGMRLADGDYLLILNNDIIVGPDWLENMVRLAESDPTIGMVGPRSNYIAGPQVVADVPYRDDSGIQDFIRKWQKDHELSAAEFGFIKGFCHLIPRRVFDKVGFYDERFGKGNFEDDDYCVRVRYHGFKTLMADDSFIHHYGSVSFKQDSVDWQALMIENRKKYEEKWARGAAAVNDTYVSHPAAAAASSMPAGASAAGSIMPKASDPMDEGRKAYERGDLTLARNLFLEAQTRNPNDPEAYCSLGVVLFSQGAAKQAVSFFLQCLNLAPAHEDAAQNLLDALAGEGDVSPEEIRALISRYPSNAALARARAAQEPASGSAATSAAARPAAIDADARGNDTQDWKHAAQAPERTGWLPAPAEPAPLPAWRREIEALIEARKHAAAMDLIESHMRRNQDPAVCYNYLGIIAHACGDAALALEHFRKAVSLNPADVDSMFNAADSLIALGRTEEAARMLEDGAAKVGDPTHESVPDLAASAEQIRFALARGKVDGAMLIATRDANQKAEGLMRSGALTEARALLEALLENDPQDFRALNNLGLAAWYREDGEEAWKRFAQCLAIRPAWSDALINALDAAMTLARMEAFKPLLEKAAAASPGNPQVTSIRAHMQSQGPALRYHGSYEALEANAALLRKAEGCMSQGRQREAVAAYLEAVELQAQNPQAYNGLGIIAFAEKRFADAYGLFDTAAGLHPADQDILLNLWQAAQALRREGEVLPKLRHSLERNPGMGDVRAAIREFA